MLEEKNCNTYFMHDCSLRVNEGIAYSMLYTQTNSLRQHTCGLVMVLVGQKGLTINQKQMDATKKFVKIREHSV